MSDFTSNFWSVYVAGITLAGIVGCLLLLWISGTTQATTAQDNSTGHVWDGDLREMNNPLPRWWVGMFIITCIFGLVYLAVYPGLGSFGGVLSKKWTSTSQFEAEVAKGNAEIAPIYAGFANKSIPELSKDLKAKDIGQSLFMNNCAQCHGSDAGGAPGFPNLTDKQWNWGGTPEAILETITNGRTAVMTPMAEALGTPEDAGNVANYVLSLSNAKHDPAKANLGREKFELCAACHGPDGKGNQLLGSANLVAGVFTHGRVDEAHVLEMINGGKIGVMPAWEEKFTPAQLKVLAAYVWGLGGGEPSEGASAQ
jgi:cytochrome c oxidase cbb3-type subunit 3